MPMVQVLDPYTLPRPYPMVVKLLAHRTGIVMSPQRAAAIEKSAMKKLRKALAAASPASAPAAGRGINEREVHDGLA